MIRLTLAQMRRSAGRLSAAGIAIVISTAFVTATLLVGALLTQAMHDSVTARFAEASFIVQPDDSWDAEALTPADVAATRALAGIDGADGLSMHMLELQAGELVANPVVVPTASDARLQPLTVTDGRLPSADDEIALPAEVAQRLGLTMGDTVDERTWELPEGAAEQVAVVTAMTLVGIVDDPGHAFIELGGAGVVTEQVYEDRLVSATGSSEIYGGMLVALAPGADEQAVVSALGDVLPEEYSARTRTDVAQETAARLTGGQDAITFSILAFAAIALVVAALVIANTFQVLVAQRTRALALLRCVGASKRQLRGSVVLEAAILGVLASAVGIVAGAALVQGALLALRTADLSFPLPDSMTMSASAIVWPLVVGTAVTVVAGLVPARAATRVAPLAALRPAEATGGGAVGRTRLVLTSLLVLGGGALLALGLVLGQAGDVGLGTMVAVLGGAVSFVGLLVGAPIWVPKVVGVVGRLLTPSGASARLAAANTTRNPHRTAATTSALLIGVTLVAMMAVGGATARTSLNGALDSSYPFDMTLEPGFDTTTSGGGLSPDIVRTVRPVEGVATAVALPMTEVEVPSTTVEPVEVSVYAISADDAAAVSRTTDYVAGLAPGSAIVTQSLVDYFDVAADGPLVLTTASGARVTLDPVVVDLPLTAVLVAPDVMAELDPAPVTGAVWLRISDDAEADSVVTAVRDALADRPVSAYGPALERLTTSELIDGVLAGIFGLLAVAVVIALVGVANTLSLSVLERRRESATLRAIGLSRRQLRRTLAIEGMVIAGVGGVVGVLLGVLYGSVGSAVILSGTAEVRLTMPWTTLALVVGVALVAGLAASVLPARTAARTSPVEALAVD